jgi:hypothetical protein
VFRMRKGVAVRMDAGSESSECFREELREKWVGCLSEQDRGAWSPHWTVMNKVDEEERVREGLESVKERLWKERCRGKAEGVTLWRYLPGGRWEEIEVYGFDGGMGKA